MLLTKHILPDEHWAGQVYEYDVVYSLEGQSRTTQSHFGSCEARLHLEGEDVIAGAPWDKVTGATWTDKKRALSIMTVDDMKLFLELNGGFIIKAKTDSTVVLPSGYIIINAPKDSVFIRWPVAADVLDTNRVVFTLESLMNEYPNIRDPKSCYSQLLECLKGD